MSESLGVGAEGETSTDHAPGWEMVRFESLIALINNEGLLVWTRYSAMLTANSIIAVVAAALASRSPLSREICIALLLVVVFGAILSWQWRGLTHRGWQLQEMWVREARKCQLDGLTNPFVAYDRWCDSAQSGRGSRDAIHNYALAVTWLFFGGYLVVALYMMYTLASTPD